MTIFTLAVWTVRPGREDDFVRLWTRLGERTLEQFPHAAGTLVRDRENPRRFISFGPWQDLAEVERWRSSPAFSETVAELRELLEAFEPGSYDLVRRVAADGA